MPGRESGLFTCEVCADCVMHAGGGCRGSPKLGLQNSSFFGVPKAFCDGICFQVFDAGGFSVGSHVHWT